MYICFASILNFFNVFQALLRINIQNFHGMRARLKKDRAFSFTSYCYNLFERKLIILEYSQVKKEVRN
jgi:hypothetical protein